MKMWRFIYFDFSLLCNIEYMYIFNTLCNGCSKKRLDMWQYTLLELLDWICGSIPYSSY